MLHNLEYSQVSSNSFVQYLNINLDIKYRPFVTVYTAKQYREFKAKCYLSATKNSGYVLMSDGDITSVFSRSKCQEGKFILPHAICNNGIKLDCFDGFLVEFYKQFDFIEYDRWLWNDKYAPKYWPYEKYGRPDIVFLGLESKIDLILATRVSEEITEVLV